MADYNTYYAGTTVRTSAAFAGTSGPADPTTTVLKYIIQGGTVQTPSPVHDSTGNFHYDIDTTNAVPAGASEKALVTVEWIGTGNVQAPGVDYFYVKALPL